MSISSRTDKATLDERDENQDESEDEIIIDPCQAEACGGNPQGQWDMRGVCPMDLTLGDCDWHWEADGNESSGTMTLYNDGTFRRAFGIDISYRYLFDYACLGLNSCYDAAEDGSECYTDGTSCRCEGRYSDGFYDSGTWSAEGTNLTLIPELGAPLYFSFCVYEDRLDITDVNGLHYYLTR